MARQVRSQHTQASQSGNAGSHRRTSRNSPREMRRRKKRRRQSIIMRRIILVVLLIVVIVFAPTVFFRVSEVTVTGDTRYTPEELIQTSGVREGDNMFFLDTGHIISLLEAKYPYLDTIKLHRKMPSTLQIEVSDRVPVFSMEQGDGYLLLDITGKILGETDAAAEETTQIIGASAEGLEVGDTADNKHEKIIAVIRLMELMTQYEMNTSIRSIDIQKAYDVRVQYEDRYTILLGSMDEEQLEHKIQFLQAILKEPSLPESGIIDLTGASEARYRPEEESASDQTVVFEEGDVNINDNASEERGTEDDEPEDSDAAEGEAPVETTDEDDTVSDDAADGAEDETADTSTGFVWSGNFMLRLHIIG